MESCLVLARVILHLLGLKAKSDYYYYYYYYNDQL